jgi:hypothetical protein
MQAPARNDDPISEAGFTLGVLALSYVSLLYVASLVIPPPTVKTIRLLWDNPPEVPGTFYTEVWASTNLVHWTLKTNVWTNRVTLYATNAAEFFKIRNKGTNGLTSDWSRK